MVPIMNLARLNSSKQIRSGAKMKCSASELNLCAGDETASSAIILIYRKRVKNGKVDFNKKNEIMAAKGCTGVT